MVHLLKTRILIFILSLNTVEIKSRILIKFIVALQYVEHWNSLKCLASRWNFVIIFFPSNNNNEKKNIYIIVLIYIILCYREVTKFNRYKMYNMRWIVSFTHVFSNIITGSPEGFKTRRSSVVTSIFGHGNENVRTRTRIDWGGLLMA